MGKLEELEEELYGREEEKKVARRMKKRVFFPGTFSKISTRWSENGRPREPRAAFFDRRFLKFFLWGLAITGAVGGALFLFLYLGTRGQEAEVLIYGRERVEAGEEVKIPIVVKNISRTVLRETELVVVFPQGFTIGDDRGLYQQAPTRLTRNIPDLPPGEEARVEIVARIFGHEFEEKKLEATVIYRPENLRARFSAQNFYTFIISRVPLAVSWDMPEVLSSGQEVEFKVYYSSTARGSFEDIFFRLDYPPGFVFLSADPKPSVGDTIWNIGTLEPNREGTIIVLGKIQGGGGEVKNFVGGLGKFDILTKEWRPYSESSREARIFLAPLSIEALLDGSRERNITPGERLNFTLRYRNNTDFAMKNVSVEAYLEGTILELATILPDEGGVFDGTRRAVLWSPGGTKKLTEIAPHEEGEFRFSVSTKERPPVRSSADQNLVIRVRSVIDAKTIPQELSGARVGSEDTLEFKVRSKVLFSGKTLYRGSGLVASGPLPPKVGAKTSYAIVWEVRNFTNALDNAEVRASLPPNVSWEDAFSKNARLSFDQKSGQILWKIGELKAGTGILGPTLTAAFLLSILPSEADMGRSVTLLRDARLTGRDTFTGEEIEVSGESLTTELREDITTTSKDWVVTR